MNELSEITLQNIEHISDVRKALSVLEEDILSERGVGISLPSFESSVATLSLTAREYQRII